MIFILIMERDFIFDLMIYVMVYVGGKWKLMIFYVIDNGFNWFGVM